MAVATTAPRLTELSFPLTPVPKNPLGEGKYIKTAAALVIGYVLIGIFLRGGRAIRIAMRF